MRDPSGKGLSERKTCYMMDVHSGKVEAIHAESCQKLSDNFDIIFKANAKLGKTLKEKHHSSN